jgi:hypothetical protein
MQKLARKNVVRMRMLACDERKYKKRQDEGRSHWSERDPSFDCDDRRATDALLFVAVVL